jgi:hypothetical protein
VRVDHEGNQSSAAEEVECVVRIVESLLQSRLSWIDEQDRARADGGGRSDRRLRRAGRAAPGARVGTVDKFQGQEGAPG